MAIHLGDISLRHVNLLLHTAQTLGVDTKAICQQYNLSEHLRQQANARISIPRFMRIGHELIAASQRPELGLLAGAQATPSLLGIAGLTAGCAPNLQQAAEDLANFELLSSKNARGRSNVVVADQTVLAEFYSISPYNEFNLFIVDFALSAQLSVLKHFSRHDIQPKEVQIEFPEPSYANIYADLFGAPVRFDQPVNALVFHRKTLQTPPVMTDAIAYRECRLVCEAQLNTQQKNLSFLDQVMNEISPLLHSPELSLETVATRLELPVWTLQRKLKAENSSFRHLVDQTRHQLALIYLKDAQYSLGEIAYLLGFAHANAFYRAFNRWQGKSPGAFRIDKATK